MVSKGHCYAITDDFECCAHFGPGDNFGDIEVKEKCTFELPSKVL